MTRVIGFDVSSTTLAWATVDYDIGSITLFDCGYIKPIKTGTIIERLADTRNKVEAVIEQYQPDEIAIEDIVQFMPKQSSAITVITLAVFNRMVGLCSYDYLGNPPDMLNVMTIKHCIRKQAGLKKIPAKEDIPELLKKVAGLITPQVIGKKGKVKDETFDMSDAIAVAYSYIVRSEQ
jgi:Holliday junction resolvasome RuvABC endonuclease subunit